MGDLVTFRKPNLEPELTDEYLAQLAENFLQKGYRKRYGISFEKYLEMKKDGVWEEFKKWN